MATVSPGSPATSIESTEPENFYEIIDGQVVEKPPIGAFESDLAFLLAGWLSDFLKVNPLGRTFVEILYDFRPLVDRHRRPDVSFILAENWPVHMRAPRRKTAWAMVPDLAVEIVSPTNPAFEVSEKIEEYFRVGVKLVWIMYPSVDQVDAYQSKTSVRIFDRGTDLDGGTLLPGFRLSINDLFGDPA